MSSSGSLLREIIGRRRRAVVLGSLGWSSHQVCEAMVPVAFGLVIDRVVRTGDGSALVLSVLGIVGLFLVLTTSWQTGNWILSRAAFEEAHSLRQELVRSILRADHDGDRQRGEQLSIVTSDAQNASEVVQQVGWLAAATVGLLTTAVVLLRIDWLLGLGILVAVPLVMLGMNALSPFLERRTAAQQQGVGLAAAVAADLLQGLRPLRGFGGVPEAIIRYRRTSQVSLRASVGAARARGTFQGASVLASGLVLAAVAGVAGMDALSGRLTVGELITVVGLAAFLSDPVSTLSQAVGAIARARASAARVIELRVREDADQADDPVTIGTLELVEVSAPGLDRVSFAVRRGELVGVVSPSAVAASALTALFSGQRPTSGTVRLGGVELADLAPAGLRRSVLVEPHAVHLFGSDVREALTTGPEAEDLDAMTALDAAAVEGFAERAVLLDHALLDQGVNLSGGQRQRVAMARALLTQRPVLVLRDPTTAVDGVTEAVMADGLRRMRVDRHPGELATVVITTSPPLLARCDRVVYLDPTGGTQVGRHDEMIMEPRYAEAVLR